MLADDILALLRRRPMTIEEVAKELGVAESDVLIPLYGELKGLVKMESGGKWKRVPSGSVV